MTEQRDLITGGPLPDCDDEYIRQAVERLLLDLGYAQDAIWVDHGRAIDHDGRSLCVKADLLVASQGRPAMVLRCARGSLVSRERETVATARLLAEPWLPLAVVTNGEDAELLDVVSGKVLASGLTAIPGPERLAQLLAEATPHQPSPAQTRKAAQIYDAYSFIQCPGQCTA